MSACTGIIADKNCEEVILEPRKIAVRYIKTWFLVDLLSSLPFDYIILFLLRKPTLHMSFVPVTIATVAATPVHLTTANLTAVVYTCNVKKCSV